MSYTKREGKSFQHDRPTFVKTAFRACGKGWKPGAEFKWREMSVKLHTAEILFKQGFIHHDAEKEVSMSVGDGLEALDKDGLHALLDKINKNVKDHTLTTKEYDMKRCKKSQLADKQRALIRSWRRNYGNQFPEG